MNWDRPDSPSAKFYPGQDFQFRYRGIVSFLSQWLFYVRALFRYDIFHFSNAHGMSFGPRVRSLFRFFGPGAEIALLRRLGKSIVYSNNGCLDGVAQSSFAAWEAPPVCAECPWRERPDVCSDERNLMWGRMRNRLADYQILHGGNRVDYNDDPSVHECPQFYCVDPEAWRPDLKAPEHQRLHLPQSTVKVYHAVGNYETRTDAHGVNLKSTHIWRPVVERLRDEGLDVEFVLVTGVPIAEVRYIQVQCDIVVDMLTFGFFGSNVKEAMMLGKPAICYLRPAWLESMREEIPEYVRDLPVVSATPETAYDVLRSLVEDPERRAELGGRGREFALRWHSPAAGADRLEQIYNSLRKADAAAARSAT